jgi:hypothetical protein
LFIGNLDLTSNKSVIRMENNPWVAPIADQLQVGLSHVIDYLRSETYKLWVLVIKHSILSGSFEKTIFGLYYVDAGCYPAVDLGSKSICDATLNVLLLGFLVFMVGTLWLKPRIAFLKSETEAFQSIKKRRTSCWRHYFILHFLSLTACTRDF